MNPTVSYYQQMNRLQKQQVPIDWHKVAENMADAIEAEEPKDSQEVPKKTDMGK